ncbi:MAG TPA: ATP-binding cassette domain-containing protein [Burkholderiaceae bacterium]|nr:ATP-binding cassette domain-containing protein [Burkholderiaceae bacterium]
MAARARQRAKLILAQLRTIERDPLFLRFGRTVPRNHGLQLGDVMFALDRMTVDLQNSRILRGISLQVAAGQLVCLIGRNGAGKTTTFRTIMGHLRPVSGTIALKQSSIVGLPTHKIAQLGIGYAPEESQVFGDLNVLRDYALAAAASSREGRRKMVSIALALDAELLLLDEPFEGLWPNRTFTISPSTPTACMFWSAARSSSAARRRARIV